MVLLIIIPMKNGYFIGGIHHFQTYPYDVFFWRYHGLSWRMGDNYFKDMRHGIYIYIENFMQNQSYDVLVSPEFFKMINLAGVWRSLFLDKAWSGC